MDVARLNVLDAAVIELDPDVKYAQAFLPARGLPPPTGTARPAGSASTRTHDRPDARRRRRRGHGDGAAELRDHERWFQRLQRDGHEGTMFATGATQGGGPPARRPARSWPVYAVTATTPTFVPPRGPPGPGAVSQEAPPPQP